MKKMKGIMILAIMLVTMFGLTGCGKTTVNLNEYVTINVEGYDSMGTASYEFDYDAFENDYSGKIKFNSKNGNDYSKLGLLMGATTEEMLLDVCVSQKLDKTSGLSNGDKVILKWDCEDVMAEEYFNATLKYSDIEYTVSDLEEVESFNPFDYVTVSFSGISPKGTVTINPDYNQSEIQYVTFTADRTSGLKTGDVITITAKISGSVDSFVENFGCVLEKMEETYTVDGLASYISDVSDIPEDMYNKMDAQLRDNFNAYVAQSWVNKNAVQEFENIGNYLVTLKDGMYGSPNNYLYYVYKVTTNVDDVEFTYYWYGYFTDVLILADGTCSVDLSKYKVSESSSFWGIHTGDYLECYDGKYYVAGFADLETFINQHIISKIEKYEYIQTIE